MKSRFLLAIASLKAASSIFFTVFLSAFCITSIPYVQLLIFVKNHSSVYLRAMLFCFPLQLHYNPIIKNIQHTILKEHKKIQAVLEFFTNQNFAVITFPIPFRADKPINSSASVSLLLFVKTKFSYIELLQIKL